MFIWVDQPSGYLALSSIVLGFLSGSAMRLALGERSPEITLIGGLMLDNAEAMMFPEACRSVRQWK
jgi:hypothetical protein